MIIPMKKAQIVVLKEDKIKLLENLQKNEILMLISEDEKDITYDISAEEETIKRANSSLNLIKRFKEKKGLVREEFVIDYNKFMENDSRRLKLIELIEIDNQRLAEIKNENLAIKTELSFYNPWADLEIQLKDLNSAKYAKMHTGFIDNYKIDAFIDMINEVGGDYKIISRTPRESAIFFVCYVDDEKELLEKLKLVGFNEIIFKELNGTPREIISELELRFNNNTNQINAINGELQLLSKEENELLILTDKLAAQKALKTAPVTETYSTSYLVGWVRTDQLERLEKIVKKTTEFYDLLYLDPNSEDVVPTATKNNKFVSAFEPITNMFSVPSINDVDPNPVMGLWYWFIFGMMMGDAGYGVLLAIGSLLLIKITKPKGNTYKMFKMFFYGAFATIFWGIMFSSYFGFQLHKPIILDPSKDILKYLILSMIVGGAHLITGYLVKFYSEIKNGRIIGGFLDNMPWVFLITGIGLLFIPKLNTVGIALAITAAALIVLTHGRKSKNIFAKFGGGLYSLYNSVNVFSDILSYSRILALSLSSAIIGQVMNILAGMLHGSFIGIILSVFVYIAGHIFNLVMGLLSAYVHDSRLQYIEFFGKFYDGGGIEFQPLSMNLKHIDKIEKVEN